MIYQVNPSIPVITPKGKAQAIFLIDHGMESDLEWVCFQDSTGECWSWKNPEIRAQKNITLGRDYISPFYNPEDVSFNKEEEEEDEEQYESSSYEETLTKISEILIKAINENYSKDSPKKIEKLKCEECSPPLKNELSKEEYEQLVLIYKNTI